MKTYQILKRKIKTISYEAIELHELGHQQEQKSFNLTQKSLKIHNLPSLPHLPTKQTKGKEPLVDYSQSHVITFEEYFAILKKKTMDKVVVDEAIKTKRKQKKDDRLKKVVNTLTSTKWATL